MTTDAHESSLPDGADALAAAIRAEVGKAFIGQEDVLDAVMIALLAGGHVLLEVLLLDAPMPASRLIFTAQRAIRA